MIPVARASSAVSVASVALLLAAAPASAVKSQHIDLATPEGAIQAARKVQCSLIDGEPTVYYFKGEVFSRVPGEGDRKLFNVEGMNIRTCASKTDPKQGTGWRLVSRELLFYVDHKSGQLLRKWDNPWTGKSVDVLQTANDPVNQRWQFPRDAGGNPNPFAKFSATVQGDNWWDTITVPLFYTNPLAGDYQRYIGGAYHATEMFNFFGTLDDLTDPKKPNAAIKVGWVRMASWLPWMEMGDRAGLIYIHAAGRKLDNWEQLPAVMKDEINASYPLYKSPPPLDDARTNETSWTYFKKKVPNPAPVAR
jgi:Protein of unknown function (DUF1838)